MVRQVRRPGGRLGAEVGVGEEGVPGGRILHLQSPGHAVGEGAELQRPEDGEELVGVGVVAPELLGTDVGGHVGAYGGHELGVAYLVGVLLDFLPQGPLELVGVVEHVLDRAEPGDELGGGLLAHARAAGYVVDLVAHERQQVYHLAGIGYAIFLADLLFAAHLDVLAAQGWLVLQDLSRDELSEVLVGRHHVDGESLRGGAGGEGADDVVGLVAGHLHQRYAVCVHNLLYHRYGGADVLGHLLSLGLVSGVGLVAEGGPGRVEADGDVRCLGMAQQLLEGVDEAEHRRGVLAPLGEARHLDQGVVGPVDQREGVEQV